VLVLCGARPRTRAYIPRDRELQREPLYFYPATGVEGHPSRSVLPGNDLGFWQAHQKLAEAPRFTRYAVVGST